jgi:hypothetical protein
MTVTDLIEQLKALPGDSDLRAVVCEVAGHIDPNRVCIEPRRPCKFEAEITKVTIYLGVARIHAWGWL